MSKNIDTAKSSETFKHSLDKEAGSRDAYLTISDIGTKFGTGLFEMVLRMLGCFDIEGKNHWKRGNRKSGGRIDGGNVLAGVARAYLFSDKDAVFGVTLSKRLQVALKTVVEEIMRPSMSALQSLRGDPLARAVMKSQAIMAEQVSHFEQNPKELEIMLGQRHESTLAHIESEAHKKIIMNAWIDEYWARVRPEEKKTS